MARVSPFKGIRYSPAQIDLSSVLSPPYDVIDSRLAQDLYGRAMQNMVRVELGRDYPEDREGSDRYSRAAEHLRVWSEEGFLVQDAEPCVYLYRQTFLPPDGGGPRERLGCFASVEPVDWGRREVLRHELTLSGPREDRVRLLQATGVQSSAVLMLYQNSAEVTAAMAAQTRTATPVGEAVTEGEYGQERHQLWRVDDPAAVEAICAGLSRARLFIADGHHRFETAQMLHLDGALSLLAPLDGSGNVILATHRILARSPHGGDELMTSLVGEGWDVVASPTVSEALSAMAELGTTHHAFAVLDSGGIWLTSRRRQAPARPGSSAGLDVSVLEREILEAQLGVQPGEAAGGRIGYSRDPHEVERLAREPGTLGFLVNPTSVAEVAEVALAGEAMPQKSTYFFPKVPAGLVLMRSR